MARPRNPAWPGVLQAAVCLCYWAAFLVQADSLSPAMESRRRPDWRLEDHLLEFQIQVDASLYVHTMWPCEDPVDTALFYCSHEIFESMPQGYCDLLRENFVNRYEQIIARQGGVRFDCSRLTDYKRYFHPQMQLAPHEVNTVIHAIHAFKSPANVLIWGAGFDSELWCKMNAGGGGRTVFIEQNPDFAALIQPVVPECPIHVVSYTTRLPQAQELLWNEEALFLQGLPQDVLDTKWDVILIDGPTGYDNEQPGRMQSIFMSSKLVHEDSVVCVDDANRMVESTYSKTYLGRLFSSSVQLKGTDTLCFFTPKTMGVDEKLQAFLASWVQELCRRISGE